MMDVKRYPRESLKDEKGMVLVVALLLIAVLVLLGTTAVITSTTDMKISSNYRASSQDFYIAEAGAEAARATLCQAVAGGATLSTLLMAARGVDNNLTDSNIFATTGSFANFFANGAFVSDDVPFVATTSFGFGTYRVYLTNDPAEGVTNATDSNNTVTLTSFGLGPQSSMVVVQVTVRKIIPPNLPGAIVLPGPNVIFAGGNSSAQVISGMTEPAVAVNSAPSLANVIAGIPKPGSYIGDCPGVPCVQNLVSFPPPWESLPDLKTLVSSLASAADFTSTSAPGFTWGSTSNPKIVYIDGNATIGPETGAGIILCTGNLSIHGNFNYQGLILAIGKGSINRYGGGNGQINGSVYAANIAGADGILNTGDDVFGAPTYDTSGGGTSDITYNINALNNVTKYVPFIKQSWKQL